MMAWMAVFVSCSRAQDPDPDREATFAELPDLGPLPGTLDPKFEHSPGALQSSPFELPPGIIGGRRRGPRISRTAGRVKGQASTAAVSSAMRLTEPFAFGTALNVGGGVRSSSPNAGGLPLDTAEEEGPTRGLTLDAAIARMIASNPDLQALKYELPQADADTLTAGLRSNPILYMDTQFIPYGAYNSLRPIGPIQYDVNITFPLDLSHKRKARVQVARAAKRVLEAQYQDVVRKQIGNLAKAFVDVQSAAISLKAIELAVAEQERLIARKHRAIGTGKTSADDRIEVELEKSRSSLNEARDTLADSQEALALLLNLPPEEAGRLELRGSLRNRVQALPPLDDLIKIALTNRPDLMAARLGENRAHAEVKLAQANKLDDIYFFYDPISYQDNRPSHLPSGRSWDVGIAIPLPITNRNQGNIARARHNVSQTQTEHGALHRRVISEVRQAQREYESSRQALAAIEKSILPRARAARDKAHAEFVAGTLDADEYLNHIEDDAETARIYRDAILRHRRSMIDINTSVALRLLP